MRNLYYVAIEGPIGVGKTSLAKLVAERLSARIVLESFEENPFLADLPSYSFCFRGISSSRNCARLICSITC
jgi:deoxyadenosine/deoxycytidine kinase